MAATWSTTASMSSSVTSFFHGASSEPLSTGMSTSSPVSTRAIRIA